MNAPVHISFVGGLIGPVSSNVDEKEGAQEPPKEQSNGANNVRHGCRPLLSTSAFPCAVLKGIHRYHTQSNGIAVAKKTTEHFFVNVANVIEETEKGEPKRSDHGQKSTQHKRG